MRLRQKSSGSDVAQQYIDVRRGEASDARHERAAQAVAENGGRSAPQSTQSRSGGLTPEADWRGIFPSAPTPQPFISRPPTISARDAAIGASPKPFMPQPQGTQISMPRPLTSPDGNAGTDAANLALNTALYKNPSRFVNVRGAMPANPVVPPSAAGAPAAFNPATARQSLYQTHPEVFQSGTPQNEAFVAHAKEFGEESAFRNVADILPPAANVASKPAPATPAATARRINIYDDNIA